jgi:hypothetical protein
MGQSFLASSSRAKTPNMVTTRSRLLFREPFRSLIEAKLPPMVLDSEIAVPDDRGITDLDALSDAITNGRPEQLAYFARPVASRRARPAPLPHWGSQDAVARCHRRGGVRADRLRQSCSRQRARAVRDRAPDRTRGIVSKQRGSFYHGGESLEWLKTKCSETSVFAITGFSELGEGRLDAVYVAEARDGVLCPAAQIPFFVGKGLWHLLDQRRASKEERRSDLTRAGR